MSSYVGARLAGAALPRHLVSVWNPAYAHDAMEEHLAVLLRLAALDDAGAIAGDDIYVWWGKVRSPNRQTKQAHVDEIRAIGSALSDADDVPETHLYLTDYRSLYVGDVGAIIEGALPPSESSHVPRYYAESELNCDFWFRLHDIRRLVHDDLPAVVEALKHLRNTHYADRPVSLYGGMVDLPLIVMRPDGARFFEKREREQLASGMLWAEFDASLGTGVAATERTLREDMLGETAWAALEPLVRTFLATAERVFRDGRTDAAFDFGPVITGFSKALEVQVNALLRRLWPRIPRELRLLNVDGRSVDVGERTSLGLQQLVQVLGGDRERAEAIAASASHGSWLTGECAVVLDAFRMLRNEGTHESRVDRRTATHWRDRLLGVGCTGVFVELTRVRPK